MTARLGWATSSLPVTRHSPLALAAYESLRRVCPAERRLIPVFDHSASLLGGFLWLRWLYLEHRRLDNPPAALARLDNIVRRLEHLAAQCAARGLRCRK